MRRNQTSHWVLSLGLMLATLLRLPLSRPLLPSVLSG
jgi:hypothetical protein